MRRTFPRRALCGERPTFTTAVATGDTDCLYSGDPQDNPALVDLTTGDATILAAVRQSFPDGQDVSGVRQGAWWVDSLGVLVVDRGDATGLQVMLIDFRPTAGQSETDVAAAIAKAAITGH